MGNESAEERSCSQRVGVSGRSGREAEFGIESLLSKLGLDRMTCPNAASLVPFAVSAMSASLHPCYSSHMHTDVLVHRDIYIVPAADHPLPSFPASFERA